VRGVVAGDALQLLFALQVVQVVQHRGRLMLVGECSDTHWTSSRHAFDGRVVLCCSCCLLWNECWLALQPLCWSSSRSGSTPFVALSAGQLWGRGCSYSPDVIQPCNSEQSNRLDMHWRACAELSHAP
jgi:hypothetical protein